MIQSDEMFALICDVYDCPSSDLSIRVQDLKETSLGTLDHELGTIFINLSHIVKIKHRYTISLVSVQDGNVLGVSHCMCGGDTNTITAMHLSASFDGDAVGGKLARQNLSSWIDFANGFGL